MTLNLSSPPLEDIPAKPVRNERYFFGCDLGQSHDPTANAVVRRIDGPDLRRPIFQVGHLERLPLGTPYPGVVNHVVRMLGSPRLRGKIELVIDFTGVGRPVFDMFQGHGVTPIGISITSGDTVTNEGMIYKVPKLVLISRVQALLHDGRLKIHKGLAEAATLVAELQDFRAEVTDSGYWRFGARSGKHDDLVLAVAIALFRAHGSGNGLIEYYRLLAAGLSPEEIAAGHQAAQSQPQQRAPDFGFAMSGQVPGVMTVALRVPPGLSAVCTCDGRKLRPRDGVVHLTEKEFASLGHRSGFVRVDQHEPNRVNQHAEN